MYKVLGWGPVLVEPHTTQYVAYLETGAYGGEPVPDEELRRVDDMLVQGKYRLVDGGQNGLFLVKARKVPRRRGKAVLNSTQKALR